VGELLGTLGTNLSEDELSKLVKLMDKDGSGEVCVCVCVRAFVCVCTCACVRKYVCTYM
jgi:Ca2+-binding EF-hand superfamily protein